MSLKITLPGDVHRARSIHAGVTFHDGVAVVESLTSTGEAFFRALGATVSRTDKPAIESAADVEGLTIAQLRDLASEHDIVIPSKGNQAELAQVVAGHLFPATEPEPIVQTIPVAGDGMGARVTGGEISAPVPATSPTTES